MAALRRRTSKRSGEELQRGGWALVNLQAMDISKGKGKGKEKGRVSTFWPLIMRVQHQ